MIWFFERKGEHLRCEIRAQVEGDRYDLVITQPDGRESVERFAEWRTLRRRTVELERALKASGWNGPFARDW